MLGGTVVPLQRDGAVRDGARHVEQCAAARSQVLHRGAAAMHRTPVDDVELAPHVVEGDVHDAAVDTDAGVVHPRVDAAELVHRALGDAFHLGRVRDVGHLAGGPTSGRANLADGTIEVRLVARRQYDARALSRRGLRGDEPDAARGPGHDHDLLVDRLQRDLHVHHSC
jgi:hypothetical protein